MYLPFCLSFLLLWVCVFPSKGQQYITYYNLVNEAQYLFHQNQVPEAVALYKQAFKLEKPVCKDLYMMAKCYGRLGEEKNMYKYFEKAIQHQGAVSSWLREDLRRDTTTFNPFGEALTSRVETYQNKEANILRQKQSQAIIDTIQYFRNTYYQKQIIQDSMQVYHHSSDSIYAGYREEATRLDSIFYASLTGYILSKGYPDVYLYGESVSILLTGISCSQYTTLKPFLLEGVKNGKVPPYHYAGLADKFGCDCEKTIQYHVQLKDCILSYEEAKTNRLTIGMSIHYIFSHFSPITNIPEFKVPKGE